MRQMYSSKPTTTTTTTTTTILLTKPIAVHFSSTTTTTTFRHSHNHTYPKPPPPLRPLLTISPLRSTTGNGQNSSTTRDDNNNSNITPIEDGEEDQVEIKLRRGVGSRRKIQRRRLDQETFLADELARIEAKERKKEKKKMMGGGATETATKEVKKWEDMSLSEKALELYVGEKGALYWLNKFAYASIFIIIGGWIVFRFVGPALNLYQLDAPPLPPAKMFKE